MSKAKIQQQPTVQLTLSLEEAEFLVRLTERSLLNYDNEKDRGCEPATDTDMREDINLELFNALETVAENSR